MARLYCTREAVKAALENTGSRNDALIDSYIETASVHVEALVSRVFIPVTKTEYYSWPQNPYRLNNPLILYLDPGHDLLAVTLLQVAAQDTSPATIPATDYFLEPVNEPPYRRIEIDLSSSSSFYAGDTTQRSIAVTGRWAYSENTKATGALAAAIANGTDTTCQVTDASLIGVGDTLLCGTEAMLVTGRTLLTTGTTVNDASVLGDNADVTITVASGAAIKQGEVIQIESEKMLVDSISGNDLTVVRGWDGSVLAAHATGLTIYASRTLTIVRGVNGTTAASHLISAALSKYAPEADVTTYCIARTLALLKEGQAGWTGQLSSGAGGIPITLAGLAKLEDDINANYGTVTV